jgi:uncharacterized protein YgiB involved in biofilm formation
LKRSEYIALGAIGLMFAATVWPRDAPSPSAPNDPGIATGDGFQTLAFANLEECRATQVVTSAVCETQFREAEGASTADAPKFAALDKCEAEFGANACRLSQWQGAPVFVPALAGVLIARSLMNGQTSGQPLYPPRTGPAACSPGVVTAQQPECQARTASSSSSSSGNSGGSGRSYYSTGSGRTIGRVAGAVVADVILAPRTYSGTSSGGGSWSAGRSSASVASVARSSGGSISSSSRPMSSSVPSSSATTSRGGFGSIGHSSSSGS